MPDIKPGDLSAAGFGPAPGKTYFPNSSSLMRRPVTSSGHPSRDPSSRAAEAALAMTAAVERQQILGHPGHQNQFRAINAAITNVVFFPKSMRKAR